jgi:hypothetical protein
MPGNKHAIHDFINEIFGGGRALEPIRLPAVVRNPPRPKGEGFISLDRRARHRLRKTLANRDAPTGVA